MSDFNIGQFLKNAFDYSTGKMPTQQPTKAANEQFKIVQQEAMKQLNQTVQNITQNFVQQQNIMMTQMQLKELSNFEKSLLLKNLLEFPENIKDISTFLAQENIVLATKDLKLLMTQPLDISKLLVLLQTNGKAANDKITKMIATMNQSGMFNTQQLKEMSVLVNACIPANDAAPQQILKSFMLMYLPWIPINGEFDFNMSASSEDTSNGSGGEDSITIIITTKNFGLVKAFLFKDNGSYNIDLNCNEHFPKDIFNLSLGALKENASVNVNPKITYTTRKTTEEENNNTPNVNFSKTAKVTPELLILIHAVIKIVMEIDERGLKE